MSMTRTDQEIESQGAEPAWWEPRAAYVHVPFCAHKCGYCDFASVAGQDDRAEEYLEALEVEMAAVLGAPRSVSTLFVGGGTPTYLAAQLLERLLERLEYWFRPTAEFEYTVESNPNTLSAEKVAILADHGVNRVSLGAQSFEPRLLTQLERNHDPNSVGRAFELLRPRIENLSLDLIFGVPTQTAEDWARDLERALELEPEHLSTYGLTYEKGTRLWSQRRLGVVRPVDEELERWMYEHALDRLAAAGFAHYEISNFARGGMRRACRHNLVYWANDAYFGFGTGAAAYRQGERTLNTRELGAYIERCRTGRSPVSQREKLEPEARARETAIVQLRRRNGLERASFEARTGFAIEKLAGRAIEQFTRLGLLEDDGASIRLSRSGLPVADGILQQLL